jgi:lambda repressor-like predicted transcriptional regulator
MESEPAKRVRVRRSREEIAELIASYRQSGQRQREFCQQRGIGLSTLQNYLRRERTKGQQKHRRLLEVEVVAKRSTAARETQALELIVPNGYRIAVGSEFRTEALLRLLEVVERIKVAGF